MNNDIKKPIGSVSQKSRVASAQTVGSASIHAPSKVISKGRNMDIARSRHITKFRSVLTPKPQSLAIPDIAHQRHPLARKADTIKQNMSATAAPKTSQQLKEEAITEAFQKLENHQQAETNSRNRNTKLVKIASLVIGFVFIAIITYLVYLNIPALSVNIANAQAGINATIPEYKPDGYNIDGPASYGDGEVTIRFKSNDGTSSFHITQSRSTWDSSAIKNKISKESDGKFITTEERGLTIFSYRGNASWVNGGILYNIAGNAQLSSDQIRKIATSL